MIVGAQTGSEIYLADLKISKTGLSLSNPKNITNRKGYDNQAHFHPDKPLIYFSSFNDSGRADIKTFNYKTQETKLFTESGSIHLPLRLIKNLSLASFNAIMVRKT